MLSKKKERSNRQRLAAIQERKKALAHRVPLRIPENQAPKSSSHTIFSNDSVGEPRVTLFGSSDEEDGSVDLGGRRFEGAAGQKLLQLQRRIGVDARFRLDEKFLEDSSGEKHVGDDINGEFDGEKSRSLAVIDSILGTTTPHKKRTNDVIIPPRYDPLSSTRSNLEQTAPDSSSSSDSECEEARPELTVTTPVSQDRYFSVNTDLKNLFDSQQFSFLGQQSDHDDGSEASEHEIKHTESPSPSVKPTVEQITQFESVRTEHRYFFHHSTEPASHSFYRQVPLSELEAGWTDRRSGLKQCFRKRHKDAVKAVTKIRKHAST